MIFKQNSIFNQFMREIRDEDIQKDSMRFRRNIERIGEIMAYEISKTFDYKSQEVTTPLGVIIRILRLSFKGSPMGEIESATKTLPLASTATP
jgi:uracil phosphoribosyltransferase